MKSFFYTLSLLILLSVFALVSKVPPVYAACVPNYQSCDPNDPNANTCCSSAFYCSGGYCILKPTPIPTPAQPCTGHDGPKPCRNSSCYGTPSDCEINGGVCIGGYCYPQTCRYGQSANDCPDGYTCQSGQCKLGYIQCAAGQAQVPCSGKQDCIRECGVDTVDCQNSVCVSSISPNPQCDSKGGVCVDPSSCNGTSEKSDCQGILECCIPVAPGPTIRVYDPTCNPAGTHGNSYGGVKTALGCLSTDPQTFIYMFTPWAIGIGAGIAFLLGLYGALMIVISAGDPEKMQAGRELITSAVAGLLLIVFAVFILRIIGVDVLKLF